MLYILLSLFIAIVHCNNECRQQSTCFDCASFGNRCEWKSDKTCKDAVNTVFRMRMEWKWYDFYEQCDKVSKSYDLCKT